MKYYFVSSYNFYIPISRRMYYVLSRRKGYSTDVHYVDCRLVARFVYISDLFK